MDTDAPPLPAIKKEEPQDESLVREKQLGTGAALATATRANGRYRTDAFLLSHWQKMHIAGC